MANIASSDIQLFIPENIKVGFCNREDTYTKKLAYVIYYDQKGKLRKEISWQSWRDSKIEHLDLENRPISGFVLNKGVGGNRGSYGHNVRNEYIRVYDPRGFEFEISVANLLFILRECDCNKGKGLEGEFVYSWDGKELVLLPIVSQEYKNSHAFTQLIKTNIKIRDLIKGATYVTKKQKLLIYLGRFDYYQMVRPNRWYASKKDLVGKRKRHVFWNGKEFAFLDDASQLACLHSDAEVSDYADLVEKYYKSKNGSKIVSLFSKKVDCDKVDNIYIKINDKEYAEYKKTYNWHKNVRVCYFCIQYKLSLTNNVLTIESADNVCSNIPKYTLTPDKVGDNACKVYALLESGEKFAVNWYYGLTTIEKGKEV